MPTQTEAQLPLYSSIPANLGAITCTTQSVQYTVGFSNGPGSSTLGAATVVGATTVTVASATSFYQGEAAVIDGGKSNAELVYITNITGTTFTVSRFDGGPLVNTHTSGANIVGASAAIMPIASGRLAIDVYGTLQGGTANDGGTVQIVAIPMNGSQVPPTAGTALASVVGAIPVGPAQSLIFTTAASPFGFAIGASLGGVGATNTTPAGGAGLTVGVPYVFDLLVADTSVAGHTITAKSVVWSLEEV